VKRLTVVLAVALIAGVALYLWPQSEDGEVIAGTVDEILSRDVVYLADARLYVVSTDGGFVALWDDARHVGDRVLYCALGDIFSSPAHGETFDRSGRYVAGPASGDMATFPVSLRGHEVIVDTSRGPQLRERSATGSDHPGISCQGAEGPPGFYENGTP
jgi:hypothetical protein